MIGVLIAHLDTKSTHYLRFFTYMIVTVNLPLFVKFCDSKLLPNGMNGPFAIINHKLNKTNNLIIFKSKSAIRGEGHSRLH